MEGAVRMVDYTPRPGQFRLPAWAHQFLAEESTTRGITKTEVVLEGLECLKRSRHEDLMKQGYVELRDVMAEEVQEWDCTLMDGLEEEEW
jgi:hypothetical protein